jgi:hypothetical protein
MRKLMLAALAALTFLAAGGCRVFCDDCPSRHYRYTPPPVVVPAGQLPTTAPPY